MGQRVIDLSLVIRDGMRGVKLEQNTTAAKEGYNTTNYHLYSHAATHMDAPLHFIDGARTIDKVDLAKCVGPAHVIDLTYKKPNSFITVDDLERYDARIGTGDRLLLHTNWSYHANQESYYRNNMPRISVELAHWMVKKGIVLVGMEMPSVASLRPENRAELTEVHQILLSAEIVIVESLANLDHIDGNMVQFMALPLKVENCDGSPVRAVAIEYFT